MRLSPRRQARKDKNKKIEKSLSGLCAFAREISAHQIRDRWPYLCGQLAASGEAECGEAGRKQDNGSGEGNDVDLGMRVLYVDWSRKGIVEKPLVAGIGITQGHGRRVPRATDYIELELSYFKGTSRPGRLARTERDRGNKPLRLSVSP